VWNTFDAHRLLHWAELQDRDKAVALKQALFRAYFTDNENVADRDVLVRTAGGAGFDGDAARRILESGQYSDEVRSQERRWQHAGIHSVPAAVVNGQFLISGGQPPEVFETRCARSPPGRRPADRFTRAITTAAARTGAPRPRLPAAATAPTRSSKA